MTRRSYRSTVRERAAAATRAEILDAAEALFAEYGYARVTISRVAEAADVAQGTVYAAFGSKPALVVALTERAAADPAAIRLTAGVATIADGAEIVALTVAGSGDLVRRHERTMVVVHDNSTVDPDITAALDSAESLMHDRFGAVTARLAELGALRDGVSGHDATWILEYYLGPRSWRRLRDLGRSWRQAEEWLTEQVAHALLGVSGGT